MKKLLRTDELAALWGYSARTIREYRAKRGLPAVKKDWQKEYRYDPVECEKWYLRNV